MVDERSHPARVAGSHQARMPEPTPKPGDFLLEAGGVDGERQRAGQHLHQEAAAGRLFERHEHAAIADGSHLALHPVGGLERVPQCRAEISHERANMVAGCRRPQPSQGGHEILFDFKPHRHLTQAAMHRHDHAQLWIEVVLEHGGPDVLQVEVGIAPNG